MNPDPRSEDIDMEAGTGTSIFRWETASGLEHTCYACPTKANHPKARQLCYGIHSIPCYRYHPTMHAIGTSHNCFACIQADNQHHERHKKIAELRAEYNALVEAEALASVKNKKGRGPALHERDVNVPIHGNARNQAVDNLEHDDEQENDPTTVEETSSISAPSTTSSGTKHPKPTKAEQRAAKREAKDAKSRRKSLKNQSKHTGIALRGSDIEAVALILHGEETTDESHPLATDKCIEDVMERNRRYVTSIREHKALLLKEVGRTRKLEQERTRKARKRKERDSISNGSGQAGHHGASDGSILDEEQEALVNAVLIKLGLPVDVAGDGAVTPATPVTPKRMSSVGNGKSTQEMAMVLAQLRIAIADDLVKHENEQRQTCIRAGGFWRYVGRQVFERMMAVAERIDWKTGMQKKPRKGADPYGDDEDDDENNDAGPADEGRGGAPRDAADDVQEWVEDVVGDRGLEAVHHHNGA